MSSTVIDERARLSTLRRLLFWGLAVGILGTAAELVLLGHFEGAAQLAPLILLAISVPALIWYRLLPATASVLFLRSVMVLCVLAGGVGVGLHYLGNQAFELEMYPSMSGVTLMKETISGATPVLAPGSMALLGVVGLAYTLCE